MSSPSAGAKTARPTTSKGRGSCQTAPSAPYNATVLPGNGSELVLRALALRPWWRPTPEGREPHFWWGSNGQHFDWDAWHSRPPGAPKQLVNRLKGNAGISVKDRLCLNLRKYSKAAKLEKALAPLAFVLTGPPEGENELKADWELMAFRDAAAAHKLRGETMWIAKPAKLNRGRGIQVFNSAKQVEKFLSSRSWKNPWVVQKYIENPLLLAGRKFDIRQLVLVTPSQSSGGIAQRVYMYRDSYVRTSSVVYNPSHEFTKDTSMHLVNDAVQSKFETYGMFEDSNKLSFPEFDDVLKQNPLANGKVLTVEDDLWPAMRLTVSHIFRCALSSFAAAPPGGAMFELFGLDFMVDDTGRLLLIEVNTQPALGRHGHVLQDLMPRMMEEVVQKAIDPLFPPPADVALAREKSVVSSGGEGCCASSNSSNSVATPERATLSSSNSSGNSTHSSASSSSIAASSMASSLASCDTSEATPSASSPESSRQPGIQPLNRFEQVELAPNPYLPDTQTADSTSSPDKPSPSQWERARSARRRTKTERDRNLAECRRRLEGEYKQRQEDPVTAARARAQTALEKAIQAARERSLTAATRPPWMLRQRGVPTISADVQNSLPEICTSPDEAGLAARETVAKAVRSPRGPVWAHVGNEFIQPGPIPHHLRYLLLPSGQPTAPGFDMERRTWDRNNRI